MKKMTSKRQLKARQLVSRRRLSKWKRDHGIGGTIKRNHEISDELYHRFCANFKMSSRENCWLWTGPNAGGYGNFCALSEGRAYRVSWIVFKGAIAKGKWVLHRCNQKLCVNPHHLYLGNSIDNARDRVLSGTGQTKLTPQQVLEIRELAGPPAIAPGTGVSKIQTELAKKFGVSRMTISSIQRRATWRWLV